MNVLDVDSLTLCPWFGIMSRLLGFLHSESCTHSKIHSYGCCLCSMTLSSKPHSFTLCSWCSWPSLQNQVLHSLQSEQEITGLVDVLDVFNVSRSAEKRLVSAWSFCKILSQAAARCLISVFFLFIQEQGPLSRPGKTCIDSEEKPWAMIMMSSRNINQIVPVLLPISRCLHWLWNKMQKFIKSILLNWSMLSIVCYSLQEGLSCWMRQSTMYNLCSTKWRSVISPSWFLLICQMLTELRVTLFHIPWGRFLIQETSSQYIVPPVLASTLTLDFWLDGLRSFCQWSWLQLIHNLTFIWRVYFTKRCAGAHL